MSNEKIISQVRRWRVGLRQAGMRTSFITSLCERSFGALLRFHRTCGLFRLEVVQASRIIRVRFSDGEKRVTTDVVVAAAANAVGLAARQPAPDTGGLNGQHSRSTNRQHFTAKVADWTASDTPGLANDSPCSKAMTWILLIVGMDR